MKKSKRMLAAGICLLLLFAAAVPALAAEETRQISEVQPRYGNIYQTRCELEIFDGDSANVCAWAETTEGIDCDITVRLMRGTRTVATWTDSSSGGYVNVDEDVGGLAAGTYQAVMNVVCGTDKETIKSSKEDI